MSAIGRRFREWWYGRQFAKKGKGFRLKGTRMIIDGHVEIGNRVQFRDDCILRTREQGKIIFGDYCGLSWGVIIESEALVQIGDYTGIAEYTVLRDNNHAVIGTDEHWRITPHIAQPIIIGKSCLIGSGCYIEPGVTIGDGAIVAPHSVVNRDIGSYEIWAGNPARRVMHRTKNVPETMMKRMEDLLSKYGMKKGRYGYSDDEVRKAHESENFVDSTTQQRTGDQAE